MEVASNGSGSDTMGDVRARSHDAIQTWGEYNWGDNAGWNKDLNRSASTPDVNQGATSAFAAREGLISGGLRGQGGRYTGNSLGGQFEEGKADRAPRQFPNVKASMVMGIGSQIHSMEAAPTVWKTVVETHGPSGGGAGGGGLMAECFKTMQKYQIRCQRLELQLQNMQRMVREAQRGQETSIGSKTPVKSYPSVELLPEIKEAERGPLEGSAGSAGSDRRVLELEAELDREKERRFKVAARLKSSQIALKAMQGRNKELITSMSDMLGFKLSRPSSATNLASLDDEGPEPGGKSSNAQPSSPLTAASSADETHVLKLRAAAQGGVYLASSQVDFVRMLWKGMSFSMPGDESDEEVPDQAGTEDWRPYVLQEHPGKQDKFKHQAVNSSSPRCASPDSTGRGRNNKHRADASPRPGIASNPATPISGVTKSH